MIDPPFEAFYKGLSICRLHVDEMQRGGCGQAEPVVGWSWNQVKMNSEESQQPGNGGVWPEGAARKLVFYGSSRSVSQGLVSARGVLLASLLGPESFGVWSLFRIAMLFGSFASLGVFRGLELVVAQASSEAEGETRREQDVAATAIGLTLIFSGLVGGASLIASFFISEKSLVGGLRVFAVVLILESLIVYGLTYLRARGSLKRYGLTELVFALVHLILAGALTFKWGLSGAFVGYLLASLVMLPIVVRQVPFRASFSMPEARRLLEVGFPVALTSILGFALVGVERLVVGAYAGMEPLGYYAFAVALSGLTASLAWVVRTVVMPDVYGSVKADGASEALRQHFSETILPFSRLYPILVGVLAIGVGPAVALLLPQYLPAVTAARLVIFAGVTAGFASLGSLGVVAAGRQRILPALSALLIILNVLLCYLALRFGLGIDGVAAGTLFSRTVFGISILAVIAQCAELEDAGRFSVGIAVPLVWCAAVVFALDRWLGGIDLESAVLSLVAYLVLVLPLFPGALRRLRQDRG